MDKENRVAYINLTGDYVIEENGKTRTGNIETDPNLSELNAFLGAVRGSIAANEDVFLTFIRQFIEKFKHVKGTDVTLSISTTVRKGIISHDFKISGNTQ